MKPISRIDNSTNQLLYRGMNVSELCVNYSYEDILHLLLKGNLPSKKEVRDMCQVLIDFRIFYQENVTTLEDLAKSIDSIREENEFSLQDTLLVFVSLVPLVVANKLGEIKNQKIERPIDLLQHAANFLWMVSGTTPNDTDIFDFQTSLILHMDDPMNPSLTALSKSFLKGQSLSDTLLSALSAHVEPLHHGAGTEAMRMFEEIRNIENPRNYLIERLDSGRKIFGLGHRIYTAKDPRAIILSGILKRRVMNTSNDWLLEVIEKVTKVGYRILKERKGIEAYPNVDLYNAAVYLTFGFPPEFNTDLFAISRAAGWVSHLNELHSHQI
ncbi:MAG: citrate/2-methylcitrate synthase [Candidatus Odinarchaeota archaeon]